MAKFIDILLINIIIKDEKNEFGFIDDFAH